MQLMQQERHLWLLFGALCCVKKSQRFLSLLHELMSRCSGKKTAIYSILITTVISKSQYTCTLNLLEIEISFFIHDLMEEHTHL